MTAEGEQDAGQRLRALGWHQGALIPIPESLASLFFEREHAIVASQDCDVLALTESEAAVDVLPAVVQMEAATDLLYGKNPRRLCLPLMDGRFATVDIRQRVTVPKDRLANIAPLHEASATFDGRKLLAKWLGNRYSRPAFPDAFNERLRAQQRKLERLSKRDEGKLITTVFVMLDTEDELGPDQQYQLVVWFACRAVDVGEAKLRAKLESYAGEFAATLSACDGITVAEHELRHHDDITLEDLEVMKRFDWDFRSEAPKPGGSSMPVAADKNRKGDEHRGGSPPPPRAEFQSTWSALFEERCPNRISSAVDFSHFHVALLFPAGTLRKLLDRMLCKNPAVPMGILPIRSRRSLGGCTTLEKRLLLSSWTFSGLTSFS